MCIRDRKFLVGEGVSFGLFGYGLVNCMSTWGYEDQGEGPSGCASWALIGGGIGLLVFRVWELADVWGAPIQHNRRVRDARARGFQPFVAPTHGGGQAGFSVHF